jgi:hypothetical protein
VANATAPKTPQNEENVAVECGPVVAEMHGKEEVAGARQALLPDPTPARLHTYYTGSAGW